MLANKLYKLIIILIPLFLFGCANETTFLVVKNCEMIGPNLYSCEEIPRMEFQPRRTTN